MKKTYDCQRTLNRLHLKWWHFLIKSVWFQHSKFSKVAKVTYNSASDVCLVIFVHNLPVQPLEFDQNSVQTWQNNFTSSTMADILILLWFPRICAVVQMVSKMVGKLKMMFFLHQFMNFIFIYFSKRWRGGYWRVALVRRNIVYWIQYIDETSYSFSKMV